MELKEARKILNEGNLYKPADLLIAGRVMMDWYIQSAALIQDIMNRLGERAEQYDAMFEMEVDR